MATTGSTSISDLLSARLRVDGDKPLVTSYDLITGERTELSVATADNWVSKAANHLREGLEVDRGDPVGLLLGTHWATPVLLLACWRVGGVPVVGREAVAASGPAVTYVTEERAGEAEEIGGEKVLVGRGIGARLSPSAAAPTGSVRVFTDEVLAFADDYDDPAVDVHAPAWSDPPLSQADLLARTIGWPRRGRVLTTVPAGELPGATAVLGAVAHEGSLLLVRTDSAGGIDAELDRIASDERATHRQLQAGDPRPV